MTVRFILSLGLCFFCKVLFAAAPVALNYQNRPIDPLCFAELKNDSNQINLKDCGLKKEKYLFKGRDQKLIEKGFFGYNWQSSDRNSPVQGYSYYKIFPVDKDHYWFYTINNGGGSGEFTSIYLVKRSDPNHLTIKSIMGGDRCNGGIKEVSLKDKQLNFSVNLTAYDLITLSNKKIPALKAYDDLASCATCCFAQAIYQLRPNEKIQLNSVKLNNLNNLEELSTQGNYQGCFNSLFVSYIKRGTRQMDEKNLDEFVMRFVNNCLHQKIP